MNTVLYKVLQSREERALRRDKLANKTHSSLSLTLNIPGYPKSNETVEGVFSIILNDLEIFLKANRIQIVEKTMVNFTDEAGHMFLVALDKNSNDLIKIKEKAEKFEESHKLGRIIDVDIFDEYGKPISSGKSKKCIICENSSAVNCMREQKHDYKELRAHIFKLLKEYKNKSELESLENTLTEFANRAILYEISLSPKPGLVNYYNSGAHEDMNFYSFLNSASALAPFWRKFVKAGSNFAGNPDEVLPIIRQIGLQAESIMFKSTSNVNTHKGIIFLMGLSVFAVAWSIKQNKAIAERDFIDKIKQICLNLIENELLTKEIITTHGENCFKKYGYQGAGARHEVQKGMPIVFDYALPYCEEKLKNLSLLNREKLDEILHKTLLLIISHLNDSNVLYRKGKEKAAELKKMAELAFTDDIKYNDLNEFCLKENISPGGSADMLAITLFFFFVKTNLIV